MASSDDTNDNRTTLDELEKDWSVKDFVMEAIPWEELQLRKTVVRQVLLWFAIANAVVLVLVGFLAWADWVELQKNPEYASQRIIGREVVMTLIGATTVQVGTIMFSIAGYLFPKRRTPDT